MRVILGGSGPERGEVLRQWRGAAEQEGWLAVSLRALAVDRHVPYGVLQEMVLQLKPSREAEAENPVATPLAGLMAAAIWEQTHRADRHDGGGRAGAPSNAPSPASAHPGGSSRSGPVDRTGKKGPARPSPLALADEPLPRPEEVRAELASLVRTRSAEHPMLLTLEGAEHVDASSRTFLSVLAREIPTMPVVLSLAMPEAGQGPEVWREALSSSPAAYWSELPSRRPSGGTAPEGTVRADWEKLAPPTREAVLAVALAGPDATVGILRSAFDDGPTGWDARLAPALRSGLVRREGSMYQVAEEVFPAELEHLVAAPERRAVHRAIARSLGRTNRHPSAKMLFRLAEHWSEAGVPEEAVPAIVAASAEAGRRGAHEEAEAELLRALLLAQEVPGREGRLLEESVRAATGLAQEMQGKLRAALASYEAALATARELHEGGERWAPYLAKVNRIVTSLGDVAPDLDRRLLDGIAEVGRQRLPGPEAELRSGLALRLLVRGMREEGRAMAESALELAQLQEDPRLLARALRMAALALFTGQATPQELQRASELLQRTLRTIAPEKAGAEYSFALDDLASLACTARDEAAALRFGERSVAHARRVCARGDQLLMLGNYAEHQLHARDLAGAERSLREVQETADRYGFPEENDVRQQWMLSEGLLRQLRGDHAASRALLERTVALGERIGARDIMGQALAYLVVGSVEEQAWDRARAYLRRLAKEGLRRALYTMTRERLDEAVRRIPPRT